VEPKPPDTHQSGAELDRLRSEYERLGRQLGALLRIGQALSSVSSLDRLLQLVADEARILAGATLSTIMLVSEDGESLELHAISGQSSLQQDRPTVRIAGSLTGRVVSDCTPIFCDDVQAEPLFQQPELARRENLRGLLAVPIMHDGVVTGVVCVYTQGPPDRGTRSTDLLTAFASQTGAAIASARRLEQVLDTENMLRQSERMALLGMMAAELAHEVRNPITVIQMLMTAMSEDQSLPEHVRDDLAMVMTKLQDIERIVSRSLDLASAQDDDLQPVHLPEVVDTVLKLLDHRLRESLVKVERDFNHLMGRVMADRGQVQQVLLNLLLNALEALKQNDQAGREKIVRISLRETARDGQQGVEASMRDNGPGLPMELSGRVFEPFVTGRRKGTGLGLYICNKIVQKHLGVLRSQNNHDGPGCTMTFWLPQRHAPHRAAEEA